MKHGSGCIACPSAEMGKYCQKTVQQEFLLEMSKAMFGWGWMERTYLRAACCCLSTRPWARTPLHIYRDPRLPTPASIRLVRLQSLPAANCPSITTRVAARSHHNDQCQDNVDCRKPIQVRNCKRRSTYTPDWPGFPQVRTPCLGK